MRRSLKQGTLVAVAIGLAILFEPSLAQTALQGCVVGIVDGDTLDVLLPPAAGQGASPSSLRVRIGQIDAPEKAQPFGQVSKRSLSDLCFGKVALVSQTSLDRYGRTVAAVACDGADAAAHQVGTRMAWAYRQYLKDQRLLAAESAARQARTGLWRDPHAIPPWEWRRERATPVAM